MRNQFVEKIAASVAITGFALLMPALADAHDGHLDREHYQGWRSDRHSSRENSWHEEEDEDADWHSSESWNNSAERDADEDSDDDRDGKVENARSAGPSRLTDDATVMDWPESETDNPTVLEEGSDEWTCFPDSPTSPGNDPMCLDEAWMQWMMAYMRHETPSNTMPGIAYMLQGSSDASNTDPYAMEPAPGEDWHTSPPHVMFLPPAGHDLDESAIGTDPDNGGPWVMFADTPYEHLMVPVE